MKRLIISLSVALAAFATAQADTYYGRYDVTELPGCESGTGFYLGLQGGGNLHQDSTDETNGGIRISTDSKLGGFAGLKFGYTFGAAESIVRPSVEFDGFYNEFDQDITVSSGGFRLGGTGKLSVDGGAFMVNGLLRFAVGFIQPYVGVGVGDYVANLSANVIGVKISDRTNGFAWQAVAGFDYFVTSSVSVFGEYKFLNYQNSDIADSNRFSQQLLGGGIRIHF